MPDLPDWSQSVSIDATNVTVPVSGSVSITSGTVTITNATIGVFNATGTKITSARPARSFQFVADNPNPNTVQTPALDADVQALVVILEQPVAQYVHLKIAWHPIGAAAAWVPLELFAFTQQVYVIPITPSGFDGNGNSVNTLDVTLQGTVLAGQGISIFEIFEASPMWLEFYAPPQLAPNQFPKTVILTLAALTAQWIIQSVANVQITLFNITVFRYSPSAAGDDFVIGHNANLPANGVQPPNADVLIDTQLTTQFTLPLAAVQLPRGQGLYVDTSLSAIANFWCLVEYSLS